MTYQNIEKFFSSDLYDADLLPREQLLICWDYQQGMAPGEIARKHALPEAEAENLLKQADALIAQRLQWKKEMEKGIFCFPLTRPDYYLLLSALHAVQLTCFQHCSRDAAGQWKKGLPAEMKKLCRLYELLQSGLFGRVMHPGILSWAAEEDAPSAQSAFNFPTIAISDWMQDSYS